MVPGPREVASMPVLKNWKLGLEIAQRLRILTVLAENQSSFPTPGGSQRPIAPSSSNLIQPLTSTDIPTQHVHTSPHYM